MSRKRSGRGIFYTRDSGGKAEMTPSQYVEWAARRAGEFGVSFNGKAADIEKMIRGGASQLGDLFLDYDVSGNVLSRPGLDGLIRETENDPNVTHVFVPRRDRIARPNDPIDAVKIENSLRERGLTLVFMDKTVAPRSKGERPDIADQIVALIDYNSAGEYRRDLAQKILFAQLNLAKNGFSTGGRAPFGFRRWLVRGDGEQVRQLADGERVRMAGHHVVWLPGPDEEIELIQRILAMLENTPATQVAKHLTEEGIPSPNAGKWRTDNGVRHQVSGVWHQTTIRNIAVNPLLRAVVTYGRRSMGDQLRFTPDGPRDLADGDFRSDEVPKVIRNAEDGRINAPAKFEPLVEKDRHASLLAKLDERAGSQRGVPRSRDPDRNPLGCRVFDMNCSWPMYRTPYKDTFRYKCGLYQQSHGAECSHNHVEGPTATRFVLSCIRQMVQTPGMLQKIQSRIERLANSDTREGNDVEQDLMQRQRELSALNAELERVSRNMSLATSPEQYMAVAGVFDDLQKKKKAAEQEVEQQEALMATVADRGTEILSAFRLADGLKSLASGSTSLGMARKVIDQTDAKLYLRFRTERPKKRAYHVIDGGVLTLGTAPAPIEVYQGHTDRKHVKHGKKRQNRRKDGAHGPCECDDSGPEDKSLGKVSRGDWI